MTLDQRTDELTEEATDITRVPSLRNFVYHTIPPAIIGALYGGAVGHVMDQGRQIVTGSMDIDYKRMIVGGIAGTLILGIGGVLEYLERVKTK